MEELIDLQDHSQLIAKFLYDYGFSSSGDWFDIASKLEGIDYNNFKYDSSFGYCESADDYADAVGVANKELIQELGIFNFIWNGLESIITSLEFERCPFATGKINSASYFIQKEFEPLLINFRYYNETLGYMRTLLKGANIISDKRSNAKDVFALNKCNSIHSIGLTVVYKVRNEFAHGAFNFPMPTNWNKDEESGEMKIEKLNEPTILNISSRIILFTVQMMLMSYLKEDASEVNIQNYDLSEDEFYLKPIDFLKVLHFYDFDSLDDNEQLSLDFSIN